MNFRTTYYLAGALAAILLLFTLAVFLGPEAPGTEGYLLPSTRVSSTKVDPDDIDKVAIQWDKPAEGLASSTLVKDEKTGQWTIETPGPFKADDGLVRELVRQFFEARNDDRADRPGSDSGWGLDQPTGKVTLSSSTKGKEFVVTLGNTTPGTTSSVVYMKSSDRDSAIAVLKSTVSNLFKPIKALRDPYLLASSSSDISRFELVDPKKTSVELKKSTEGWRYAKPGAWGDAELGAFGVQDAPDKAPAGVNGVLSALSNIKVNYIDEKTNDYVADGVTDLAKFGLDPAKDTILKIAITRSVTEKGGEPGKPGPTVDQPVSLLVAVGKKDNDKYFAALDEAKKNVVKIPAREIDPLLKLLDDPGALRERNLLKLVGGKIDAFDVETSTGKLEFRRPEGQPWKLYRPGQSVGAKVDQTTVDGLVSQFTQKDMVKSFIDGQVKDADIGLDKPQATVSIWVDGIVAPEKKDEKKPENPLEKLTEKKEEKKEEAKPTEEKPKLKGTEPKYRLLFGKTEGPLVTVRRTGGTDALLGRVGTAILDLARRPAVAYLDKTVPSFAPGAVDPTEAITRFKIIRGGKTVEVARDKSDAPWKFVSPPEQANLAVSGNTIRGIVGTLNALRANAISSEKATDAELQKEYGLNPASSTVVITTGKDKDAKTWEYRFGKETADKTGVYARQGWRDPVFVVDKLVPSTLETELAETSLFPGVDPAKVETLKLTGWQPVTGNPFVLDLERKDGKWVAKAPANFAIDSSKVDKFVLELVNTRAEKYLSFAGAPKPEQNLDPAKGGLKIEWTLAADKEARSLTLGKAEGNSLIATAGKPAGVIFTVRKAPFDPVMAKPAFFNP